MSDKCDLSKAQVFIVDRTAHGRRQTRNALNAVGFSGIEDAAEINHSDEVLATQKAQLIVAGVGGGDDTILELVQDIRQLREVGDPFIPIILNVWAPEEELVNRIIGSGADDLLVWPFSAEQLGLRVRTLINARKKFVATQSYFGPDRRSDRDEGRGITVPNALRATALKDKGALPSPQAIIEAMSAMLIEKVHYEAQDIENHVKKLMPALIAIEASEISRGVITILRMLESIRESTTSLDLDHLDELIEALESILRAMTTDIQAIGERQRVLLTKTSRALALAAKMDDSVGAVISGISAEIGRAEQRKFFAAAPSAS